MMQSVEGLIGCLNAGTHSIWIDRLEIVEDVRCETVNGDDCSRFMHSEGRTLVTHLRVEERPAGGGYSPACEARAMYTLMRVARGSGRLGDIRLVGAKNVTNPKYQGRNPRDIPEGCIAVADRFGNPKEVSVYVYEVETREVVAEASLKSDHVLVALRNGDIAYLDVPRPGRMR
jgi:hypothetical protein